MACSEDRTSLYIKGLEQITEQPHELCCSYTKSLWSSIEKQLLKMYTNNGFSDELLTELKNKLKKKSPTTSRLGEKIPQSYAFKCTAYHVEQK